MCCDGFATLASTVAKSLLAAGVWIMINDAPFSSTLKLKVLMVARSLGRPDRVLPPISRLSLTPLRGENTHGE
jgi:hypothetical protein